MRGRALVVSLLALVAPAFARVALAQSCARPTDAGGVSGYGYGAASVRSFGDERVLVWYATSGPHAVRTASTRDDGVPDEVADAAAVTSAALGRYLELGYRPPISDALGPSCGSNGGDGRLDVYLVSMSGADGVTVAEEGRCEAAAGATHCAGFLLVQARFGAPYASAAVGLRTVLPHEAFHAVQNAYDVEIDRYWAEGTAQWATDTLDPSLGDLERFLPAFFSQTSRSLDAPANGVTSAFLYGAAIWPVFLSERHGAGIVRAILEAEGQGGVTAIAAADAVLRSRQSSIGTEFALFSVWNAAAGQPTAVGGYAAGAGYPKVTTKPLAQGEEAGGITGGLASFFYRATADGPAMVTLETDPARNAGTLVPVEEGRLRVDLATSLPATFEGESVIVVSGLTASKTDAPYTLSIAGALAPGGCTVAGGADDGSIVGVAALAGLFGGWARRRRRGPPVTAGACDPSRDRAPRNP